jgi:hypothetical protein
VDLVIYLSAIIRGTKLQPFDFAKQRHRSVWKKGAAIFLSHINDSAGNQGEDLKNILFIVVISWCFPLSEKEIREPVGLPGSQLQGPGERTFVT